MIASLDIRVHVARLFDQHVMFVHFLDGGGIERRIVVRVIIDNIDHQGYRDFVRLLVDMHLEMLVDVQVLASRGDQRILERLFHDGIVDILDIDHGLQGFDQIDFGFLVLRCHKSLCFRIELLPWQRESRT